MLRAGIRSPSSPQPRGKATPLLLRIPDTMVQYWRAAGMTYLRYSNTCADLMRNVLKEPQRTKLLGKTSFVMLRGEWEGGKVITQTQVEPSGNTAIGN